MLLMPEAGRAIPAAGAGHSGSSGKRPEDLPVLCRLAPSKRSGYAIQNSAVRRDVDTRPQGPAVFGAGSHQTSEVGLQAEKSAGIFSDAQHGDRFHGAQLGQAAADSIGASTCLSTQTWGGPHTTLP